MMSGSVEGWLQTFLCSQYTRTFEAHGYKTLHSVSIVVRGFSIWLPLFIIVTIFV